MANSLLDDAGWVDTNGDGTRDKDGVELILTYSTTAGREVREQTQVVAQQYLADVGIGIEIANNGQVAVRQTGGELNQIGEIQLARFLNSEGLLSIGKNLFIETDASGTPYEGRPLEEGLGGLRQGHLEGSNVEPVRELVDLIFTQRGFELNSQSIQSADEALRVITNLRR